MEGLELGLIWEGMGGGFLLGRVCDGNLYFGKGRGVGSGQRRKTAGKRGVQKANECIYASN